MKLPAFSFYFILTLSFLNLQAQFHEERPVIMNGDIKLSASLLIPSEGKHTEVVLIIAGSGPTDMDGNNSFMKNNHLKFLAEGLAENGIASLRFNKRFIPGNNTIKEEDLRFGQLVEDANACLEFLQEDPRFGKIYILGHSQGSLIGMMLAGRSGLGGFISLAGPSEPIGRTIVRQISEQSQDLGNQTKIIVDSLEMGFRVKQINPLLLSVFRPSVQPFLISYMALDPVEKISQVRTRVLIVQGTTDIQVRPADAEALHQACPGSELVILEGMNHILKDTPIDRSLNMLSYSNPDLVINPQLILTITEFIKKKKTIKK